MNIAYVVQYPHPTLASICVLVLTFNPVFVGLKVIMHNKYCMCVEESLGTRLLLGGGF